MGWGHLYLYDQKTGQLKHPITEGDGLVREVHHYDVDRRELLIQTAGRVEGLDPYCRDICRVNIDTGVLTPIVSTNHEYIVFDSRSELGSNLSTGRECWGGAGVSPTGRFLVTTRSRIDETPVSLLLDSHSADSLIVETADISDLPR